MTVSELSFPPDPLRPVGAVATARSSLSLKIGAPISLRLTSRGLDRRVAAQVLGLLAPRSLIVQLLHTHYIGLSLETDDELYARCIAGRIALGFKTRVLRFCRDPYDYYHLAYPEAVDVVELRNAERVRVTLPASLTDHTGRTIAVELRDISETGALFHTRSAELGVGDTLIASLDLWIDTVHRRLDLQCIVRNTDVASPPGVNPAERRLGVEFPMLNDADRAYLREFVSDRLNASVAPFST